jgi:hypothetical protein
MKSTLKKLGKSFGKALLIIMYPIFLVIIIVLCVLLFQQTKMNKDALKEYKSVYNSSEMTTSQKSKVKDGIRDFGLYIKELKSEIESQNGEIDNLRKQMEDETRDGYGEIKGSILPVVVKDGGLNLYQRVCAEHKDNANQQYCVTVSSIKKDYSLILPTGEYYVFAEILGSEELLNEKAYFTEFVQCNQSGNVQCSDSLSDKKVLVNVTSAAVIEKIDPVNWKFSD